MAEEVQLGWDAANLDVVMEVAGPLMWGQVEGLGEHTPRWLGPASWPQL